MFAPEDEEYLLRHASRANIILFVGAGFSSLATNQIGKPVPTGLELAKAIWKFLKYQGEYGDDSLADLYEALLSSGQSHARIRNFLEEQLTCKTVPEVYDAIVNLFWYRIYTTNVDDLLTKVYQRAVTKLEVLAYPKDDVEERDQSLASIQGIFLNGRLPCSPSDLTFSPRQYASASIRPQPLYQQFVRDFATHPAVFVGTRLNEPLFWQALEARQGRSLDTSEYRPKSFLVAPSISPAKRSSLARLNVIPIEGSTDEFLAWLSGLKTKLPDRQAVVLGSAPDLASIVALSSDLARAQDLRSFGGSFRTVPTESKSSSYRSVYLLGAAPRWDDILSNLDAPREISSVIQAFVSRAFDEEPGRLRVGAILGSAGAGKSTILRRVGLQIRQAGRTVFATNSEVLPSPDAIRRVLDGLPERSVLLFDNAEVALSMLPSTLRELERCEKPPVVLFASRTNDFDRLWSRLNADVDLVEFSVPNLSRQEIEALLTILDEQSLLGELKGLAHSQRVKVFEDKAQKQILVAMREATTSRGFDSIIRDEFERLEPMESKALYLCVALATDAGFRLTREEVVACAQVSAGDALHYLNRNLRDIVVPTGAANDMFLLRHRLLAELVVTQIAPRPMLRDAYVRVLRALATGPGQSWRGRVPQLVHALLNHKTIYARFRHDLEEARDIFQTLSQWFKEEPHFWLQFGNLELEGVGGDLRFAENYLRQAESLSPQNNTFVQNALGHLLMRQAIEATSLDEAQASLAQAVALLRERIETTDLADAYPVHIYCSQMYLWTKRWLHDNEAQRRSELEKLHILMERAIKKHPRHKRLRLLAETIEKAYLQSAIPARQRPDLPALPDEAWS